MRRSTYALAATFALAWTGSFAGENRRDWTDSTEQIGIPPSRATSRTLLDVVSLAIAEGTDVNINPGIAEALGLHPEYRLRVLRYRARFTPDNLEREFQVVYTRGRDGGIQPLGVLFDVAEVSLADAMKSVRGTTMFVDLEGALQKASGRQGAAKKVAHGEVPKEKAVELFKGELDFYERASLGLPVER